MSNTSAVYPVHRISFLVAALFLIAPMPSNAGPKYVNCDGCSSNQNHTAASSATQSGRVYVTDRTNDTITTYDVVLFTEFDPPESFGIMTSTPSYIGTYFVKIIGQYHTARGAGVDIPAQVASSAHSLVGNSQKQAEVGTWLMNAFFESPTVSGVIDDDLEGIRNKILAGEPIKVEFSDDSTAEFVATEFAVGDAEFNMVNNSLDDAQNNSIPDSPGDVQPGDTGTFSSNGPGGLGTRDAFVGTLNSLGIRTSGGGLSNSSGCTKFTCTGSSNGVECIFSLHTC